jgi:DNA polymerase V
MEEEFFGAAYKGSKQFRQQQVKTANATGFGAAADDYMERGIDLNEQLIINKPATFFFRMAGEAMSGCGIFPDDILIVDRSIKPSNGKIIVAAVNGELVIRRFQQTMKGVTLHPENKQFKPIEVGEFTNYNAWGVVTCVIHLIEPALINFKNNSAHKNIRESQ